MAHTSTSKYFRDPAELERIENEQPEIEEKSWERPEGLHEALAYVYEKRKPRLSDMASAIRRDVDYVCDLIAGARRPTIWEAGALAQFFGLELNDLYDEGECIPVREYSEDVFSIDSRLKELGYSGLSLSKKLGCDASTINRIRKGSYMPNRLLAIEISALLRIDPKFLGWDLDELLHNQGTIDLRNKREERRKKNGS